MENSGGFVLLAPLFIDLSNLHLPYSGSFGRSADS